MTFMMAAPGLKPALAGLVSTQVVTAALTETQRVKYLALGQADIFTLVIAQAGCPLAGTAHRTSRGFAI